MAIALRKLRAKAIRLHFEERVPVADIAARREMKSVATSTVYAWIRRHKEELAAPADSEG